MSTRMLWALLCLSMASTTFVGCDDDDDADDFVDEGGSSAGQGGVSGAAGSGAGQGGEGGAGGEAGSSAGTGGAAGGGAAECPDTPAGCFCGTPATQEDFLNQCTESAALTVELDFEPATETDLP